MSQFQEKGRVSNPPPTRAIQTFVSFANQTTIESQGLMLVFVGNLCNFPARSTTHRLGFRIRPPNALHELLHSAFGKAGGALARETSSLKHDGRSWVRRAAQRGNAGLGGQKKTLRDPGRAWWRPHVRRIFCQGSLFGKSGFPHLTR